MCLPVSLPRSLQFTWAACPPPPRYWYSHSQTSDWSSCQCFRLDAHLPKVKPPTFEPLPRSDMEMSTYLSLLLLYMFILFPPLSSLSPDGNALLSLLPSGGALLLPSWDPSHPTPCSWQGVTCSPQQRVISLSLPNTFLNLTSIPPQLSSLTHLQLLNLSFSNISGHIPSSLASLSDLSLLDLSSNSLSGRIPQELGMLSSLQFLFLNSNRLTGRIPPTISNLSSLQVLCLQDNLLDGPIPHQLGSLLSLQQLRIGGNPLLGGHIPPELGSLTNLTTFGAAATALFGPIPAEFGKMVNLQTFSLYDTDVSGSIPAALGSCVELRSLYLHMNNLTGMIPPELGRLRELTSLLLWGNSITGSIPREISNCSSLVVLDLSVNNLSGHIPGELGRLSALNQLHLSDNMLTGLIPWELSNCSGLTAIQIDTNALSGSIPPEFGRLTSLQSLFLWGNMLTGAIPDSLGSCSDLYSLDLSRNQLNGSIPDEIFHLKKLSKLLLLGNGLSGELPTSIQYCQSLVRLRLGENKMSGAIPGEIGQLQNLVFLDLYSNRFSGRLPSELANSKVLELLDVHDNRISGGIPSELGGLMNLEQLDLSNNAFTGGIPSSIGNLSYLNKLILHNNLLEGILPESIRNLQRLALLDLSCNRFSGWIPPDIGDLTSLTIGLNLSFNVFTGYIPERISSLVLLQSLDVSSNKLYGGILVLGSLTSLTSLNISFNNFSGPIPVTPFFRSLSPGAYLDNRYLCHSIDGFSCSADITGPNALKSLKAIVLICVIVGFITMLLLASWILANRRTSATDSALCTTSLTIDDFSYPWKFVPFQKVNFTIDNILECLRDDNIIGKGCSGIVYKAEMPNGELIAVKKLMKLRGEENPGVFASEIQILGNIRHRNIVRLLGYCSNKCTDLLLYNYVSNGNLQQLLQHNRNLDWEIRYKIAMGSAQGLAYLHHDCIPAILHRDVKCNNILLDSKFEAYLADFGLAKLMNSTVNNNSLSGVAGSYGYIAPEYGYTRNITEKSDVYSFGVVLLEILSGRSAIDPQLGDGLHIVEWVRRKMGSFQPAVDVLDTKLQGLPDGMVHEMLQTLGIAMFCVNSSPSERPAMKEVVALLMEVKNPQEECGKTSHQPLIKTSCNGS